MPDLVIGDDGRRPLLVVRRRPALPRLSRRRLGSRAARRRRGVRAPLAGGVPGRARMDDDPPQAGGVPGRVRGVLDPARGGVRRARGGAAAGRRGHRPPSRQDRGDDRERGRRARARGRALRARLELRASRRGRLVWRRVGEIPDSTPESVALSKELKRRGFRFVGPTTVYAFMQSAGLVDDHLEGCWSSGCSRTPG